MLVQASSGATTAPNEMWVADVCADEPHALSGLAQVDYTDIHEQMVVLYAGDGQLYQPSSGAWSLYAQQPSVGDGVLVKRGTKHAGTSHQVTLDSNGSRLTVHHSTAIATGLGNVTVNTVSTVLQHTAIEINDPQLTTINPLAYTVKSGREGIYHVHTLYITRHSCDAVSHDRATACTVNGALCSSTSACCTDIRALAGLDITCVRSG
ncbi:MAG: hypothetical protein KatS3mg038_2787 [Candidatus Kapaibacterium sp.]|nr:MAG: hypothetical protein KatS3mg038_2787 [Candidatus Kapabacteria bacterium]